jgi:hypothetical protein
MEELTIKVDYEKQPLIPFFKVPLGPNPNPQQSKRQVRRVTLKTNTGTASITVPVKGMVFFPQSPPIKLPSEEPFVVDEDGAILMITENNTTDLTVYYQVHCNDGTNQYWAEGESPPRMQIPPV